ncbi:MAG: mandelate racemase/muconate lactonizing enzyme family protein [Armatimonadetes bacterium]|nr:mandelate racemase/muconate lactonizing enzyme family protein [Armatimonadota bacterium]
MTLRITKVEPIVVNIPLQKPVFVGTRELKDRDYLIVRIHTDEGVSGYGYTDGYGASIVQAHAVKDLFTRHVVDQDPLDHERLWERVYQANASMGRKGLVVRALSAVDIALWDIKCKVAGLPLHKVLGGYRDKVPCYASGGYYRRGEGLPELRKEMEHWASRNMRGVKMRIGLASLEEDVRRVAAAREILGPDVHLMLDAELVWDNVTTARRYAEASEPYNPYWLEGPFSLNRIHLHLQLASQVRVPLATGGQEYTRWGFLEWIKPRAVEILQPDAIVCGGITEWLKIVHLADAFDMKVSPHASWDVHSHLVAATPNALFVEYFDVQQDIKVLDRIVPNPVKPDADGYITPDPTPGVGIAFDEEKMGQFRVF